MKRLWLLTRKTFEEYGADNSSQLAAGIAFYALFSIVPLALFAVSVFGLVVRDADVQEDVADEIVGYLNIEASGYNFTVDERIIGDLYGVEASADVLEELDSLDGPDAVSLVDQLETSDSVMVGERDIPSNAIASHSENLVIDTVKGVSRNSGALTIVSLVASAWAGSALFASVRRSLNMIWGTDVKRPLVQQKLIDLGLVAGFGLLLGASVASTGVLFTIRRLSDDALGPLSANSGIFWDVVPLLLPAVLSFSVFAFLYRYLPNAQVSFRTVWPGALLAAVLFEILKNGFGFYVANFNNYDLTYGALGGLMLFMLFTFLISSILLLGGELAFVYGHEQSGIYAAAASGPSRPWQEQVKRFFRGLFVQQDPGSEHK